MGSGESKPKRPVPFHIQRFGLAAMSLLTRMNDGEASTRRITVMRTSNNNNHPCDLEQLAREAAAVIDQTLVCGDFVFVTHRDRCLYIGTSTRNRPRWLEKNPGRFRLIQDVLREAALPAPPVKSEVNVGA